MSSQLPPGWLPPTAIDPAMARQYRLVWAPIPSRITVPVAPGRIAAAPQSNLVSRVTFFADESNTVSVAIGNNNVEDALGVMLNGMSQLAPGRMAGIWTDDVFKELFDLGKIFFTSPSTSATQLIHVTVWAARVIR